ncbi:MAG: glycosyltransferase family 4 protein [Pedobacter sp.]|nr:glycosyltransferase family 4 protein [Pedobacter sp.]
MKHVLKVGDAVYAQSIQQFAQSYTTGFPQREQFLMRYTSNMEFTFYRHDLINNLEDVIKEREKLKAYLSTTKFDYVMVDNPLSGLVLDESMKLPIVFDCIDWYEEMYLKEFGIDARYYLLRYGLLEMIRRADKVIAQSPVILQSLHDWGLTDSKKTKIIPNGYDSEFFFPFSASKIAKIKTNFEKEYQVNLGKKNIIVYTGKLGRWYDDLKLIAEAITDNDLFIVVGDGPIRSELPDSPNIVKVGAVDIKEVSTFTNIADVLVFPVSVDCSPIAISEYLAVGKPIVMGKGRMEWLLTNDKSGYMVDNNIYAWKKALANAKEHSHKMGTYNLNLSKNLSWELLSKEFSRFIHES